MAADLKSFLLATFRKLFSAILSFTLVASAGIEARTVWGDPNNANDQLSTDTYNADGNTTASNGLGYAYDFENHLIQQGGIGIVYDGDGNRVQKTVAGVITKYLVDDRNPTGYAQVFTETTSSTTRQYVLGLERVSERIIGGTTATRFYDYDGHGSDLPPGSAHGIIRHLNRLTA